MKTFKTALCVLFWTGVFGFAGYLLGYHELAKDHDRFRTEHARAGYCTCQPER